ncbi:MAG TPA: amidohydrolase family protein [Isosphaeraceae bacterium]|jgi:predicted TIM-barrel fold metal-dependent hydrolase
MNRRGFLELVAASTAAFAADRPGGRMIPIIDTHQHLWDLEKFRLAWMPPGEDPLGRSYRPADYAEATAGLGVVKSIYMEVDVAPDQQVAEAEYVLGLIHEAKTPMAAAVISGRPASDGFAPYLDRFKAESAIKGIRQVLHVPSTPAGYCLDPAFVRGIRELGKRGLSFDLCMRSTELDDAAKLIDACPDTQFILDHCGNESVLAKDHSPWKRRIDEIAARGDRVVCKVSGIVASAKGHPWSEDDLAPVVNHVLDVFGPSRVMFGGDWPVCTLAATYRRWVEALQAIIRDRPEADRKKLFHDNAARFYGLG